MKNFYQLSMQYWLSFKLLLLPYDEDCCRENKHIVKHIWASTWLKIKQSEAELKKVRAYKKKRVYCRSSIATEKMWKWQLNCNYLGEASEGKGNWAASIN